MLTTQDHLAIDRLYSAYNQYIDANRIEEWVELFTPDGVFMVGAETVAGSAALRTFGRERAERQESLPFRDAQHWNANLLLEPDGDLVRGSCYMVRFAVDRATGSKDVVSLGVYEDEIVRHLDGWRFARRVVGSR